MYASEGSDITPGSTMKATFWPRSKGGMLDRILSFRRQMRDRASSNESLPSFGFTLPWMSGPSANLEELYVVVHLLHRGGLDTSEAVHLGLRGRRIARPGLARVLVLGRDRRDDLCGSLCRRRQSMLPPGNNTHLQTACVGTQRSPLAASKRLSQDILEQGMCPAVPQLGGQRGIWKLPDGGLQVLTDL